MNWGTGQIWSKTILYSTEEKQADGVCSPLSWIDDWHDKNSHRSTRDTVITLSQSRLTCSPSIDVLFITYQTFYFISKNDNISLMQIGFHGGQLVDPDARDAHPEDTRDIEAMKAFVRNHFPGLEDFPSITERCIISVSSCPKYRKG